MWRLWRANSWAVCVATVLTAVPALAQSNLDAGKSAAQIFADTCNACHRSPREIKPAGAAFLRQHYTTGGREAAAMAAYLATIGSDPRAVQQRRPPVLGAGHAPAADSTRAGEAAGEAGKPATGSPQRPRRPAESIEIGQLPSNSSEPQVAPGTAAAAGQVPAQDFEE